jgi:hypothetical protein
VADRFAAVQHQRHTEVDAGARDTVDRRSLELEALRVRVQLPGAAQALVRAAAQLIDGAATRRAQRRKARQPVRVRALHGDEVVVDLGAVRGVGERPPEAHRAVDASRIHGREQFVGGEDGAPAAVTHVEPGIELGEVVARVAHRRREDVHMAVDDQPSHRV